MKRSFASVLGGGTLLLASLAHAGFDDYRERDVERFAPV